MEDKIIKKRKRGFFAALTALVMAATSLSASAGAYYLKVISYNANAGKATIQIMAEDSDYTIANGPIIRTINVTHNKECPPSCTKDGYLDYASGSIGSFNVNTDDGVEEIDNIFDSGSIRVSALGHDWDDGVVTLEPTTTSEGVRTFTCKRAGCGATYTLPIDKLPEETTTTSSRRSPIVTPPETTTTAYYNPDYVAPPTTTTTASPETTTTEATTTTTEAVTTVPETTPEETTTPVDDDTTTPPEPQEGDVIELTDPVVPAELLEQIKGKDVDVVIDLGNGLKWTINGKSITDDDLTDINLNVSIGDNGIPVQVINKVTGERFYISIHLDYDGPFPFDAELEVDLKKSNAGYYANLFYYNPELSDLEYVSSSIIDENGVAHLNFHHASDYTIVIDDKPFDGNYEDGEPEENPTTGVIPAGIAIASISAAAMLISYKRKK